MSIERLTIKINKELSFDLIAENPSIKEKIWWFFFKPFHGLFANKALRVIKNKVEHNILDRKNAYHTEQWR